MTDTLTRGPAATAGQPARPWRLRALLLALTAALVATGIVFLVRAGSARDSGAAANRAVIDSATTSQVVGQVSAELNQVLSYSYSAPKVAQAAAAKYLAGDAVAQYKLLFTQLQQRAPGQKLSFVAKVITAGVTSLHGNSAQLLVFLDQQSTRASDHQSSVAAAQVQIAAVRSHGTWQITELKPL